MEFSGDIQFADESSWLTLTTESDDPVTVTVSISSPARETEAAVFSMTPVSGVVRMPAGEILRGLISGGGSAVSGSFTATQGDSSCVAAFRVLPCRKFEYTNIHAAMLTTRPAESPVYRGAADRISFYNSTGGATSAYVRFLYEGGSCSPDYSLSLTALTDTPEIADLDVSCDTMLSFAVQKGITTAEITGYMVWIECSGTKSKTYLFDIRQSRLPLKTYKFLGTRGTYEYIHATGKFSRSVESETRVFTTSGNERELDNDSSMDFEQNSGHVGSVGMGRYWLDFLASKERYIIEGDGTENAIIVDEHKASLTDRTDPAGGSLTFKWHYAEKAAEPTGQADVPITGLSVTGPETVIGVGSTARFGVLYSPTNTTERGVTWSLAEGSEHARIDRTGLLTVLDTTETPVVKVVATSAANPQISAEKTVRLLATSDPYIVFDKDTVEIPAYAGTVTNGFRSSNLTDLTVTASGGVTLSSVPKVAEGYVEVAFADNTELLRKTGRVVLSGTRTDGRGTYSKEFLLIQAAADSETLPLRMELNLTGDFSLAYGESLGIVCRVFRGWEEKTADVAGWSIVRATGDAEADAAWLLLDKVRAFDGAITIERTEEHSDLPADGGALFTVTATMSDGRTATGTFKCGAASGAASFKSMVFRRSETAPDTPTGGSYSDPEPEGWSDGVPAGKLRLWMSTRIFTYTGEPPQQEEWTTPAAVTDTADIDLEFSSVESDPGDPTSSPDNWHNDAAEGDIWMAVRKIANGIPGEWDVAKIKGEKGDKGADGKILYTWIRYADDASGSGISDSPVASDGTLKKYIGFAYGKETSTESDKPGDYKWALFKGTDGTDGVPGEPGADGKTLYTWIKYADSLGSSGYPTSMYDTPTTSTQYIGIAPNKETQTEGNVASAYTWSKFKGDQGVPGKDGAYTLFMFRSSATEPATPTAGSLSPSGWSESVPDYEEVDPTLDSGSWTKSGNTFTSNKIGASGSTWAKIVFTTTKANAVVGILITASSENNYDWGYVCKLDSSYSTSSYLARVSGTTSQTVQITVASAGKHYIYVGYTKDGSNDSNNDNVVVEVMGGPVWMSKATVTNGAAGTWSRPVRVTPEDGDNGLTYRYSKWTTGVTYRNDNNPYYRDSNGQGVIDVVLTDDITIYDPSSGDTPPTAYICKYTHTSSSSIPLAAGTYWSQVNSMAPILSALVLAHTIKADIIDVKSLTSDEAFINYLRVKRLLAGIEGGQRVEILPENKSVDIYDSSGDLASTFEGNSYTDIDSLFGGGSGSFTVSSASESRTLSADVTDVVVPLTDAKQISKPFRAVVGSGSVTASNGETMFSRGDIPMQFSVRMAVYSSQACSSMIGYSDLIYSGAGFGEIVQKSLSGVSANVLATGWARLELCYSFYTTAGTPSSQSYIRWSNISSVTYTSDFYVARYFANGLVLGSGKDNYISIYRRSSSGGMYFNMRGAGINLHLSNDYGLMVQKSTDAGTSSWRNLLNKDTVGMPLNVLAIGNISTYSSGASANNVRTCDGGSVSVSRSSTGTYKVTIPTAWGSDYYVFLTTCGRTSAGNPRFASVYTQSTGSFTIDVKTSADNWDDGASIRFMIVKYGDFGGAYYNPSL